MLTKQALISSEMSVRFYDTTGQPGHSNVVVVVVVVVAAAVETYPMEQSPS